MLFFILANRQKQPAAEVDKYIDKITAQEDKYELYMEVQLYRKAFDAALKLRDSARLTEVSLLLSILLSLLL